MLFGGYDWERTMAYFLAKTEPGVYSAQQLEADRRTTWDGVTNPQAVAAIKAMKTGDRVFIYHSGGVTAIVAVAKVVSAPRPDERNAKSWVVDLEFVRHLDPPTALAEVKAAGRFHQFALVRQGRLSTMAVPDEFVDWMRERYPKAKL